MTQYTVIRNSSIKYMIYLTNPTNNKLIPLKGGSRILRRWVRVEPTHKLTENKFHAINSGSVVYTACASSINTQDEREVS